MLFISMLSCFSLNQVHAQMVDLIGSMGIGAAQTASSVKNVGKMNKTVQAQQFINQLQMEIAMIITSYFGNYKSMPVQNKTVNGVKVTFKPADEKNALAVSIPLNSLDFCQKLISYPFDNLRSVHLIGKGRVSKYTPRQAFSNHNLCSGADTIVLIME
jgi:hypothetical protein